MAELQSGMRFGDYELERLVGRGAMGAVWLASDTRLGRRVALKFLPPELAEDPSFRARFIAESRLAASLDHPNIVPVHEAGERDGRLFIAMRFVDGPDLETLVRTSGPLDPQRAVRLLRGVGEALDVAHAGGLVHRDVKPGNILVASTAGGEHAYLSDFGLTKRLGSGSGVTLAGNIVGSVDYIAPEQIEGQPVDGRADIYSLGCSLFAALVGHPPFELGSDVAVLWAHVRTDPPRLAEGRPDLAKLEPIVRKAMAKRPGDRYPTATAMFDAAAAALGAQGVIAPRAARGLAPAPVIAAVAAVAIAGTVALASAAGLFRATGTPGASTSLTPSRSALANSVPPGSSSSPSQAAAYTVLELEMFEGGGQNFSPELTPGTRYEMAIMRPRTQFTAPGKGWFADRDYADGFNLLKELPDVPGYPGYFSTGIIQVVFAGPCSESATRVLEQEPSALMRFLEEHPTVIATPARPVNFGSYSGLSTELTIEAPPPAGTCEKPPEELPEPAQERFMRRTYLFLLGQDVFHISPDERIRIVAVDVEGRLITLMYGTNGHEHWNAVSKEAEILLESMAFLP